MKSWPQVCAEDGCQHVCEECSVDTYVHTITLPTHTHTARYLNGSDIDGGTEAGPSATVVDTDAMFVHLHCCRPHLMKVREVNQCHMRPLHVLHSPTPTTM